MSYNGVYSRRPTDDDRRGPDHGDRRRDSFSRTVPDAYKDQRYRRDTDSSVRSRRNPPESPRDPPALSKPSRPHADVNSARHDHGPRDTSASRSPADSPPIDRNTAGEKLTRLTEVLVTLGRLRSERDPLDKVLKQRQAEYERSKVKHVDFPSVPEAQNMHRVKYAERVRFLDAQIQKYQDEVQPIIEVLVQAMLPPKEDSGPKTTAPAISLQQRETSKKQQAKIAELETKVRMLEADRARDRTEMETKWAEMKQQTEDMVKGMMKKEAMKDVKATKSLKDDVAAEVREQMGHVAKKVKKEVEDGATAKTREQLNVMRRELDEFEKRQAEQDKSRENDMQSRLAKHEEDLTKSVEAASSASVSTLIQGESSARQADIAALESRMNQATATLNGNIARYHQRLEEQSRKVEEHDSKLSNLDTDALEGAAEVTSIAFPDLQRKVAGVQAKVDEMPGEMDAKQQVLLDKVKSLYFNSIGGLSQLVDEAQRVGANNDARIKALEQSSASNADADARTEPSRDTGEVDVVKPDVALFKSDLDSTKLAVDQLNRKVSTSSEDVDGQLVMIRHSIMSLESRFNNLTTKSVAEYIIGHLEHLYPTTSQFVADVEGLKTLTKSLGPRVLSLEERVQGFNAKVERLTEAKFDSSEVLSMQEQPMKDLDESSRLSHKRKRTGSSPNGTERRLQMNGMNQAYNV